MASISMIEEMSGKKLDACFRLFLACHILPSRMP
jgi:hypothetical protein